MRPAAWIGLLLVAIGATGTIAADRHRLPDGFVYLDEAIPDLVVELRYAKSTHIRTPHRDDARLSPSR